MIIETIVEVLKACVSPVALFILALMILIVYIFKAGTNYLNIKKIFKDYISIFSNARIFVIKSPYPIAPIWLFYILTFCLIYGVLYLLFYGCALIGNFIKMAKIKCVLDSALKAKKDISVVAIEVQLNFLVSKLLGGDKQASREFYNELIEIIEKSSMNNKDELIAYLKERYTAF